MREIRMLRAMWRALETGPRQVLNGHEGGNPGYKPRMSLRANRTSARPYQDHVTIWALDSRLRTGTIGKSYHKPRI